MGGAQISLGGDFSSAYSNPAGLGMYNRSEFTISPGFMSLNNNGTFMAGDATLSNSNNANRTAINIPGLGLIFSKPQDGEGGFIHGSFAITMTKINDFNSNIKYKGLNTETSLIDYFLNQANGYPPSQFDQNGDMYNTVTELGYDNYLIGEETIAGGSDPNKYFTDVSGIPFQNETVETKGGQNQWNFAYGANFNDKFFLGAGLGIVALNFQSRKVFSESFDDDGPLNGFNLTEELTIRGTGVNLNIGGIFRPVDGFQLGAAITTPTRYKLTDTYSASMSSSWKNFDYYGDQSTILGNESAATDVVTTGYNLTTPWKFSAGASYIFGKSGLISVDVEQLNYGGAKYNSTTSGFSLDGDNDIVKATYKSVTNIRAGGEYRIKSLRLRGGFGYMPDPYKEIQNDVNTSRYSVSGGVGYRASKFFIDLAYVNSWMNGSYRPYTVPLPTSPLVNYKQTVTNVIATVGFTF